MIITIQFNGSLRISWHSWKGLGLGTVRFMHRGQHKHASIAARRTIERSINPRHKRQRDVNEVSFKTSCKAIQVRAFFFFCGSSTLPLQWKSITWSYTCAVFQQNDVLNEGTVWSQWLQFRGVGVVSSFLSTRQFYVTAFPAHRVTGGAGENPWGFRAL